jgi:hypothetical protein
LFSTQFIVVSEKKTMSETFVVVPPVSDVLNKYYARFRQWWTSTSSTNRRRYRVPILCGSGVALLALGCAWMSVFSVCGISLTAVSWSPSTHDAGADQTLMCESRVHLKFFVFWAIVAQVIVLFFSAWHVWTFLSGQRRRQVSPAAMSAVLLDDEQIAVASNDDDAEQTATESDGGTKPNVTQQRRSGGGSGGVQLDKRTLEKIGVIINPTIAISLFVYMFGSLIFVDPAYLWTSDGLPPRSASCNDVLNASFVEDQRCVFVDCYEVFRGTEYCGSAERYNTWITEQELEENSCADNPSYFTVAWAAHVWLVMEFIIVLCASPFIMFFVFRSLRRNWQTRQQNASTTTTSGTKRSATSRAARPQSTFVQTPIRLDDEPIKSTTTLPPPPPLSSVPPPPISAPAAPNNGPPFIATQSPAVTEGHDGEDDASLRVSSSGEMISGRKARDSDGDEAEDDE